MIDALLINIIKFYKSAISPSLGYNCRFYPSCSDYAIEVLQKNGKMIAFIAIISRVFRCNPFSAGGYDPVKF